MLKDETSKLCCKTFPLILKGLTNPINHYKKRNRKASLIETIVKIEDQILASRKKKNQRKLSKLRLIIQDKESIKKEKSCLAREMQKL